MRGPKYIESGLGSTPSEIYIGTLLGRLNELNRPHPPEEKFDHSPLKLAEIEDLIRKGRAKSSPGINGITYRLYRRSPKILALL